MTKKELIKLVAEKNDMTQKDAGAVIDAFVDTMAETLAQGEEISLPGFGKFVVTERAARMGRNPQTGEEMEIPASNSVKFRASSVLKSSVN